jgi:hypothetical protein
MKFQLDIKIEKPQKAIQYEDKILLIGSCFTEHMSDRLGQHHFQLCSNPNGILFNPLSVATSLNGYLNNKRYAASDLFYLNELWNSWDHHTRFSDVSDSSALAKINEEQSIASTMIRNANWVIITLGSAFQYYLKEGNKPVANNHRAPGQWFAKKLLSIDTITNALGATLSTLHDKNPKAQVLFTISPVRHIRDGVVENNRSKARLLESVHSLCEQYSFVHYFPAYEIVIDVLRDYRFYDIDMVHPNYPATSYVWECFANNYFEEKTQAIMKEVLELHVAQQHRPRFTQTEAHQNFCKKYTQQAVSLQKAYPYIDLSSIIAHFNAKEQ